MQRTILLNGAAELPPLTLHPATKLFDDLLHQAFDVDDWMPFEYLRQPMGKITCQATSGAFVQVQKKA